MTAACTKKPEDKVTEAFMAYVDTDFDNPIDFIEISKFGAKDTISAGQLRDAIGKMDSVKWMLTEEQKSELAYLQREFNSDSTFVVQHELNVRVKAGKGEKTIRKYYVIERNLGSTGISNADGRTTHYLY